jgi:hypothetical protein
MVDFAELQEETSDTVSDEQREQNALKLGTKISESANENIVESNLEPFTQKGDNYFSADINAHEVDEIEDFIENNPVDEEVAQELVEAVYEEIDGKVGKSQYSAAVALADMAGHEEVKEDAARKFFDQNVKPKDLEIADKFGLNDVFDSNESADLDPIAGYIHREVEKKGDYDSQTQLDALDYADVINSEERLEKDLHQEAAKRFAIKNFEESGKRAEAATKRIENQEDRRNLDLDMLYNDEEVREVARDNIEENLEDYNLKIAIRDAQELGLDKEMEETIAEHAKNYIEEGTNNSKLAYNKLMTASEYMDDGEAEAIGAELVAEGLTSDGFRAREKIREAIENEYIDDEKLVEGAYREVASMTEEEEPLQKIEETYEELTA